MERRIKQLFAKRLAGRARLGRGFDFAPAPLAANKWAPGVRTKAKAQPAASCIRMAPEAEAEEAIGITRTHTSPHVCASAFVSTLCATPEAPWVRRNYSSDLSRSLAVVSLLRPICRRPKQTDATRPAMVGLRTGGGAPNERPGELSCERAGGRLFVYSAASLSLSLSLSLRPPRRLLARTEHCAAPLTAQAARAGPRRRRSSAAAGPAARGSTLIFSDDEDETKRDSASSDSGTTTTTTTTSTTTSTSTTTATIEDVCETRARPARPPACPLLVAHSLAGIFLIFPSERRKNNNNIQQKSN